MGSAEYYTDGHESAHIRSSGQAEKLFVELTTSGQEASIFRAFVANQSRGKLVRHPIAVRIPCGCTLPLIVLLERSQEHETDFCSNRRKIALRSCLIFGGCAACTYFLDCCPCHRPRVTVRLRPQPRSPRKSAGRICQLCKMREHYEERFGLRFSIIAVSYLRGQRSARPTSAIDDLADVRRSLCHGSNAMSRSRRFTESPDM